MPGSSALAVVRVQPSEATQRAGANAGDLRTTPAQSPGRASIVEYARPDAKQRFLVMRLDASSPGVALIGACAMIVRTDASLSR